MKSPTQNNSFVWPLIIGVSLVNMGALFISEITAEHGTLYIWNEVFHTDSYRWRVVPLATVLGFLLSLLFLWTRIDRFAISAEHGIDGSEYHVPSLKVIASKFFVGLVGLLAGASLGPEQVLIGPVGSFGVWTANRAHQQKNAEIIKIASIGGLLVGFLGSLIPLIIPLVVLRRAKQLRPFTAGLVVLAGVISFGILWFTDHGTKGFGDIPVSPRFAAIDFVLSVLLGIVTVILGRLLERGIKRLIEFIQKHKTKYTRTTYLLAIGTLAGLALGLVYLLGGETIQFSGNTGGELLLHHSASYSLAALVVILFTKLVATGLSKGSGYIGGMIFPAMFLGITVGMIAQRLIGTTGPGVIVGSAAGFMAAITDPIIGLILVASALPLQLILVAACGILGAVIGNKFFPR